MVTGSAPEKKVRPSVQGWWPIAIVLGLLSPFAAAILASGFVSDAETYDNEMKGYLFLIVGVAVGVVLVATGLVGLLMNLSDSWAQRKARGEPLPEGDQDRGQQVDVANSDAPRPWTVAGVMVASMGWFFIGGFVLGPLLGLAGSGLAAVGRAKGERNAHMVAFYALMVTIITLFALLSTS